MLGDICCTGVYLFYFSMESAVTHHDMCSLALSTAVGPPGPVDNSDLVQEVQTGTGTTQLRLIHDARGTCTLAYMTLYSLHKLQFRHNITLSVHTLSKFPLPPTFHVTCTNVTLSMCICNS